MAALDLGARIARVGHIIHKDIDVAARFRELSINELEDKESGFYIALAK